jgi:hypothetical protein
MKTVQYRLLVDWYWNLKKENHAKNLSREIEHKKQEKISLSEKKAV